MSDLLSVAEVRDQAIEQGWQNAADKFREYALQAIMVLSETRDSFTTDDVWEYFGDAKNDLTHDTRALGGAMKRASSLNLIRPTDRFISSNRVACHGRPIRVWESQVKGNN